MDHADAALLGMEGERAVSLRLRQLASRFNFLVLDDMLLSHGPATSQLDHVIVDRFGVLVIETKTMPSADIRGKDSDATWAACYPRNGEEKGHRAVFQNPIEKNREHVRVLRKALLDYPLVVAPEYFASAVVFVGGRIDGLELDEHWKRSVVKADEIERLLEARRGARIPRTLAADEIVTLFSVLLGVDRSKEPRTVAEHESRGEKQRAVKELAAAVG